MRTSKLLLSIGMYCFVLVLVSLGSGCSREPDAKTSTLTFAKGDLGMEVWTLTKGAAPEASIAGFVNEYLVNRKPGTLALTPGLAESWESSPDGKTWTFNLRKGIMWQDGYGEFTGEDVKFSLELAASKESNNNRAGWLRTNMDSIEVANPYKVVMHLKAASVSVPYFVSQTPGYLYIMSKKYVDKVGMEQAEKRPVGTGPWKAVEHQRGNFIKFEAVKNHWRQTPAFGYLIVKKVPEESTRIAMLRSGEADIIEMSPLSKKEVESAGFQFRRVPGGTFATVQLGGQSLPSRKTHNPSSPWVGPDPEKALKVRKALNLAVNKQAIIDGVLRGEATTMFIGRAATPPDAAWMDPSWKPYPYDPQEAKKLLAEAGYPNGFEVTMWELPTPGTPWTVELAEAVAMDWEKIGIKVKREVTNLAQVRARMPDRNMAGYAFGFRFFAYDEPQDWVWSLFHTKSVSNYAYESEKLDSLAVQATGEVDSKKRAEINKQIMQLFYDEYMMVPVAATNAIYGVSSKVGEWPQVTGNMYAHYFEYITRGPGAK